MPPPLHVAAAILADNPSCPSILFDNNDDNDDDEDEDVDDDE